MAKQSIFDLKAGIHNSNPGKDANQRHAYRASQDNLLDSTNETIVATLTSVSESAIISSSIDIPGSSFITEITAVATTAFSMDSAFYALNIGTASLTQTGFTVANIKKGHHKQFMATAAGEIALGKGASSNGTVSQQLGSTVTSSLQALNTFFADDTTLHLQLSSSAANKFFDDDNGVMKVAISYRRVI